MISCAGFSIYRGTGASPVNPWARRPCHKDAGEPQADEVGFRARGGLHPQPFFPIFKLPAEGLTAGRTCALISIDDVPRPQRIKNILRYLRLGPGFGHRLLKILQLEL